MPLIELPRVATFVIDVAVWGCLHAGTGYIAHRIPARVLADDSWLTRERAFERGGRRYESVRIRRWKGRLPEAGDVFEGGVSKRHLAGREDERLQAFVVETRRAEIGHWLAAVVSPVFVIWNTVPIAIVMVVYGVAVNAPFIAIQRYNRLRISRVLSRRSARRMGASERAAARSRNDRGTTGNSIP